MDMLSNNLISGKQKCFVKKVKNKNIPIAKEFVKLLLKVQY